MKSIFLDSPIGGLIAKSSHLGIKSLRFLTNENQELIPKTTDCLFLNQAKEELDLYFLGKLQVFSVQLDLDGTEFQNKVWSELLKIPYGKTISYKELAQRIQLPKAIRAVGGANNKNKIMIMIPCHRVIGLDGNLVGYAGGIDKKKWLLKREQSCD
jgi:methylated-DNA-[protein]-cysteine S-methyltransferase